MSTKRTINLDQLARDFVLARREMADADARAKELQAKLMSLMPDGKFIVDMGNGDNAELTKVAPTRYAWVASSVKALLPVRLWNRVKTEAVNKQILEAMITSGELAAYDLEPCKEFTEVKPYLKVTERPRSVNVIPISGKVASGEAL
jgi:hypothetical protein